MGGRRIGVKGGGSELVSGSQETAPPQPSRETGIKFLAYVNHMLQCDLRLVASRGPRALIPADASSTGCPPGGGGTASPPTSCSKACRQEPGLTGQGARKPSRGTCPPLQLGSQGPSEGGPKTPTSPWRASPAASGSHRASDLTWAPRMGARFLGGNSSVPADRDLGSPTEGWALQVPSLLIPTEQELLHIPASLGVGVGGRAWPAPSAKLGKPQTKGKDVAGQLQPARLRATVTPACQACHYVFMRTISFHPPSAFLSPGCRWGERSAIARPVSQRYGW